MHVLKKKKKKKTQNANTGSIQAASKWVLSQN